MFRQVGFIDFCLEGKKKKFSFTKLAFNKKNAMIF